MWFERATPSKAVQNVTPKITFFTLDQNVGKSLRSTLTKIEVSTSFRLQDIAAQNQQFSSYFSVAI